MSDLLIWLLAISTLNNLATLGYSYGKFKFAKWRIKNEEVFTYSSNKTFYNSKHKQMQIRKYFYLNGAFYALVNILISNSFLDFTLAMLIILTQYVALYHFYLKQYPKFYVYAKGISCQVMVHPMDRDHVGKLKWSEIPLLEYDLPDSVIDKMKKNIS